MPVRTALVSVFLLLAACDSGEPEEAPPVATEAPAFVGEWSFQTRQSETYATFSQTQDVLDTFTPGSGEIRITGAPSGSVRYLDQRLSNAGGDGTLTAYRLSTEAQSVGTGVLVLSVTAFGSASLKVVGAVGTVLRVFYPECRECKDRLVLRGDTIRVAPSVFVESATGIRVVVEGELVLPRRSVRAGEEVLLSRRNMPDISSTGDRQVFEPDGAYRVRSYGQTLTGTWETVGTDSVRTVVNGTTNTYRYMVSDDRLALTTRLGYLCGPSCDFEIGRFYDVPRESVSSGSIELSILFTRATD